VDGFDFDIESDILPPPSDTKVNAITDYKTRGYATMISRLRALYSKDASKAYYISGAPQCPIPDAHLSPVIAAAWFDFLFVQFYNNPSCSVRAAVNGAGGNSFLHWTQQPSLNANVKVYLGLPASPNATGTASDYLTEAEVLSLVKRFSSSPKWGGISLWESTYSQNNVACGQDYTTWMKKIVTGVVSGTSVNTDTTNCPVVISQDGGCGQYNGLTCSTGNCCSQYGFCGSTPDFCGAGCNASFGRRGISSTSNNGYDKVYTSNVPAQGPYVDLSTMYVVPVQYPTASGGALPSGTDSPSGTGAAKPPKYSGSAIAS
jgi:chitinase